MTGTITRSYDGLDRLISEASSRGSVSYSYDAAGRRTSMTVSGQAPVTYQYDNANRLTQITQGSANVVIAPDSDGRRQSVTLPNGVTMTYNYDAASQLTGISYALGGNTLGNLTYGYDLAGRRIGVGGSFARTGMPNALTSASYNANNQLTQFGGASMTYDANGNLTSDGSFAFRGVLLEGAYTWNARNQLVSISGGVAATFQYDARVSGFVLANPELMNGRRVSKTIGGTTQYVYDGVNPVQEISGTTASANLLTGGVDEYFQRTDTAGARNYLTDAIGSTLALADSAGAIQTSYTFEPFGNTTVTGASTTNSFAFTGRELDAPNLYFYRARYYDPAIGRFISEDPARLWGGSTNFYAYANDNPISYSDPFGLQATAGRGSCQPKCFAQLKFRPVQDWRAKMIGATHSFWYVQGSTGVQYIISGGPTGNDNGNLDVWKNPDINNGVDNVSSTTWWNSGLSSDNCSGVDALINAATNWPEDTIPYNWRGPNSNSATHNLGTAGGFNPAAPPVSVGWNTPIP